LCRGAPAQAAVPTGQSGNRAGRRPETRRRSTRRLCLERALPRCHERPITFSLPLLAAGGNGETDKPSPQNLSRAMNAVTTALAHGAITPGEAATIAGVYQTFVRTAGIARGKVARGNLLQILTVSDDVADEDEGHRRCRRGRR
jgi:hypothetical protein